MNDLSNLDETYTNIQQLLRVTWLDFTGQRSKVKVTAGRQSGDSIHVDAWASNSIV